MISATPLLFVEDTQVFNLTNWDKSLEWGDYDNDGDLDLLSAGTIYNNSNYESSQ